MNYDRMIVLVCLHVYALYPKYVRSTEHEKIV